MFYNIYFEKQGVIKYILKLLGAKRLCLRAKVAFRMILVELQHESGFGAGTEG